MIEARTLGRRQFIEVSAAILSTPILLATAGCGAAPAPVGTKEGGPSSFDGNFVVGFDQDFPPYGYVGDDGRYTGFDLELAQASARRRAGRTLPAPYLGTQRTVF